MNANLTPNAYAETVRVETAHRNAENLARAWRLKKDRLIQAALDAFYGGARSYPDCIGYANSGPGTGPRIESPLELIALKADIESELSPVVRWNHDTKDETE